jgi:pimeloyl-ACP methyl ester carboxylesterase
MTSVTSADGTVIAYEQQGSGPALIVVDGALSTRGGKAGLRALLAPRLTVFGYDRRGRGDSGDTLPYSVDREIEDIQALIEVAGGTAALYGHSSGAAHALDAALQPGGSLSKIAMYEAPYHGDPAARQSLPPEHVVDRGADHGGCSSNGDLLAVQVDVQWILI